MPIAMHQEVGAFGNYCGVFCSEDWSGSPWGRKAYGTFALIMQFALPLIVICTCYTLICMKIANVSFPTSSVPIYRRGNANLLN